MRVVLIWYEVGGVVGSLHSVSAVRGRVCHAGSSGCGPRRKRLIARNEERGRWCRRAMAAFNMSRWGLNSVGSAVIDVDVNVLLMCGDVVVVLWRVFEAVCDERSCCLGDVSQILDR